MGLFGAFVIKMSLEENGVNVEPKNSVTPSVINSVGKITPSVFSGFFVKTTGSVVHKPLFVVLIGSSKEVLLLLSTPFLCSKTKSRVTTNTNTQINGTKKAFLFLVCWYFFLSTETGVVLKGISFVKVGNDS
jgi:hypothetical protein